MHTMSRYILHWKCWFSAYTTIYFVTLFVLKHTLNNSNCIFKENKLVNYHYLLHYHFALASNIAIFFLKILKISYNVVQKTLIYKWNSLLMEWCISIKMYFSQFYFILIMGINYCGIPNQHLLNNKKKMFGSNCKTLLIYKLNLNSLCGKF